MVGAEIKSLIFDLGGVIINLSVDNTYRAFSRLSGKSVDELKESAKTANFFFDFEKGLIDEIQFRAELIRFLQAEVTIDELDNAWNEMLLDIPTERIQLLKKLRGRYQLFLLSNTNHIHLECFNKIVAKSFGESSLDPFFDQSYYSHLLKMRKPDEEIYQHVIKANSINPHETLFLDDTLINLEGAAAIGIKTFHVRHPDQLFSLFS